MRRWLPPLAVLSVLLAGCGTTEQSDDAGAVEPAGGRGEPVQVVASTDVYGSIASFVGGDLVQVTSFISDSGADPLEYESTPADAVAVRQAQVVIYNGSGYDQFMPQLIEGAGGIASIVNVSELSDLSSAAEAAGEESNEHFWYDLETVQDLAVTLAAELGEAVPDEVETFEANAAEFNAQLDGLRDQLAQISAENGGTRIAVTEPLANNLLQDAGLENLAPAEFQQAIEEGTDPSAAVLQQMLTLFDDDPVAALVLNTQTQSAVTDQVRQAAEAAGVPVVQMSETLTAPEYVAWMSGQIDALTAALDA
ncbi:metal ABC transporter solute-binding protein, Zn/Mn family [Cellulomonas fimi]|uniref:Zinc ABC transporter solute-binding protein n=1 Tax=Cellulomonas fimi TaxID=1708 RepID=A0A7Y0QHU3_CELFI|nr:zinc ABC transporter substrate-binding protein [Cellulomonas fimi]NMR20249.1 zinc ABC transporter solute-binding protein [Cellulomonas fimi]